jgi:sporulation protein YlmC with PRC-barrel domain
MTSIRELLGTPVIAKDSAAELGEVEHVLVEDRSIRALHVDGKGASHAGFITWDDIAAVGADAVVVHDAGVIRDPETEEEQRAARGDLELLDKRAIASTGDEIGTVSDVAFDVDTGTITTLTLGEETVDGGRLRAAGSYAVVIEAIDDRA